MREDKREIKDKIDHEYTGNMRMREIRKKIDHEYTGIMRMREIKKRLTTNIQVICT
jgi:hypothetical protein